VKIKPLEFSFIVAISISFIFLMVTFWIFYEYAGNITAVKDALSTTGSYFGAVTTLGAAVIAAYLFTDWRDELTSTSKQEQAQKIQLALNKILYTLDGYQSHINLYSGLGFEKQYVDEAKIKAAQITEIYSELLFDFNVSLSGYQDTFLEGVEVLLNEERVKLDSYYYSITGLLYRISSGMHVNNKSMFIKYLNAMRRDRCLFLEIRDKINDEILPNINLRK
jgi:hypothetical protein